METGGGQFGSTPTGRSRQSQRREDEEEYEAMTPLSSPGKKTIAVKLSSAKSASRRGDDVQTDKMSGVRSSTHREEYSASELSKLSQAPGQGMFEDAPLRIEENNLSQFAIEPRTQPESRSRAQEALLPSSRLNINVIDYMNLNGEDQGGGLAAQQRPSQQFLTVTNNSTVQISQDDGLVSVDPRTAVTTKKEKANRRYADSGKKTLPSIQPGGPALRYVVKEELRSPPRTSKGSNEDLLKFTLPVHTAQPSPETGDISVIHETTNEDARSLPKSSRRRKPRKNETTMQDQPKVHLADHLLSPFETNSSQRDKSGPAVDALSLTGDLESYASRERDAHRTAANLDQYSKKQEAVQPQWPADLNRAQILVMNNRTPSSKPPRVVGLPDLDVCQGEEPRMLNLRINPQTAREMKHHKEQVDAQFWRDLAAREAQTEEKKPRRRSRPKRKKTTSPVEVRYTSKPPEKDPDSSFISNVIGKYIFDFDEFKRRQRNHAMSQSIDVHDTSRAIQLPPLVAGLPQPRDTLKSQLPRFVELAKRIDKPFAPTPKASQSIDLSKYTSAHYQKAAKEGELRREEHEAARDAYYFSKALGHQVEAQKRAQEDREIFEGAEFQDVMQKILTKQQDALQDFNQYFEVMTDLDRSPFVPSHVSAARRAKRREERELSEQAKIRDQWDQKHESRRASDQEAEAARKTNELLEQSLADIQDDSLENRVAVDDLAAIVEGRSSDRDISNINQQELDVDLSEFRLTQQTDRDPAPIPAVMPSRRAPVKKLTLRPKDSEDIDIALDERHIEANRALEAGDLATYSKIQRSIQRFPKGSVSPSSITPRVPNSDLNGGTIVSALGPQKDAEAYKAILDDSVGAIEDSEMAVDIRGHMDQVLEARVKEKTEAFDKLVVGRSLEVVKQTSQRMKKASLATLNELIDEYLSCVEATDLSPLLQVYDDLSKHTKLALPARSLLQHDQSFFREALAKTRRAHQVELRWVKAEALRCAREYISRKSHEIQQIITTQIRDVFRQYNGVREQAVFFKSEAERLTEKLVGYEDRVAELANYVRHFQAKNAEEARLIRLIDEDEVNCVRTRAARAANTGDRSTSLLTSKLVPQQLRRDAALLNYSTAPGCDVGVMAGSKPPEDCGCNLRAFTLLQNKYLEKVSGYQAEVTDQPERHLWSEDGLLLPSAPEGSSVADKITSLLQQSERAQSGLRVSSLMRSRDASRLSRNSQAQARSRSRGSSLLSQQERERSKLEKFKREAEGDPLLMQQFSFFSSHVKVSAGDVVPLLKDRMVTYYQGRQIQLEEYTGLLESENRFFKERNARLHGRNIVFREKVKELNLRLRHHLSHFERGRKEAVAVERGRYRELKATSEDLLRQCKQIFTAEVFVLEKVLEKALADNMEKTNLLRQFAFVLKTPRLFHEYLERNGVDPFIAKFTQVLSENEALKGELERLGESRRVRKAVSLVKQKARVAGQSVFSKNLPMQLELLIKQRSKFLGTALDEIKVAAAPFKPEREKQLQRRRERAHLSKSMSVNPSSLSGSRDAFDASMLAGSESVFSTKRVHLVVPRLDGSQTLAPQPPSLPHSQLSTSLAQLPTGSMTTRGLAQQESCEFNLKPEASQAHILGGANKASLKEFINEAIRKRPDYDSRRTKNNRNEARTNHQSVGNLLASSSGQETQSKTILHQAYLQALSQSSSMQEIVKQDYLPGNVLARSDANLARTRQHFLDQYEMINQYRNVEGVPSYKFALSSSLIESVGEVVRNNSRKKDYTMKPVQSQAHPFISGKVSPTKPLDKTRIIDATAGSSQVSYTEGDEVVHKLSTSPTMPEKRIQSSGALSQGSQASKKVLASYDNRRPFHQQVGMKDWGENK